MARDIIFRNLEAELTRAKITKAELAARIGISTGSISLKFNSKTEFTLPEMLAIQEQLKRSSGQEFTLDYLFMRG